MYLKADIEHSHCWCACRLLFPSHCKGSCAVDSPHQTCNDEVKGRVAWAKSVCFTFQAIVFLFVLRIARIVPETSYNSSPTCADDIDAHLHDVLRVSPLRSRKGRLLIRLLNSLDVDIVWLCSP